MTRLDTDKHLLNHAVGFFDIMHVISGDKRNTRFLRKAGKLRQNADLLVYAVVLNFDKEIILTENILVPFSGFDRFIIIVSRQSLWNFARKASGKRNKPVMILL